jgi:hypothetical protein
MFIYASASCSSGLPQKPRLTDPELVVKSRFYPDICCEKGLFAGIFLQLIHAYVARLLSRPAALKLVDNFNLFIRMRSGVGDEQFAGDASADIKAAGLVLVGGQELPQQRSGNALLEPPLLATLIGHQNLRKIPTHVLGAVACSASAATAPRPASP